jgi:hypothetical protein
MKRPYKDVMKTTKERIVRQLDTLSPEELQAVYQLIETFKGEAPSASSAEAAACRVRSALSDLPGTLTDTIYREREDRI